MSKKILLIASILGSIGVALCFILSGRSTTFIHLSTVPVLISLAATVFAWISWNSTSEKYTLVSGILYAASILSNGSLFFFCIAPMILCFVGFAMLKNGMKG